MIVALMKSPWGLEGGQPVGRTGQGWRRSRRGENRDPGMQGGRECMGGREKDQVALCPSWAADSVKRLVGLCHLSQVELSPC